KIGFSFDWNRCVQTNDPKFYKWTQWIFLKFFNSWYNKETNRAEPIETLINHLSQTLSEGEGLNSLTAKALNSPPSEGLGEVALQEELMKYRLAYLSYAEVNWCPA